MFDWEIEKAIIDGMSGDYTTATAANPATASAITLESVYEAFAKMPKPDPVSVPTPDRMKYAKDHGFPGWPGVKMSPGAYTELLKRTPTRSPAPAGSLFGGIPIAIDYGMGDYEIQTVGIPEPK